MSQENVATLRRHYKVFKAAFASGDVMPAIEEFYDPEIGNFTATEWADAAVEVVSPDGTLLFYWGRERALADLDLAG